MARSLGLALGAVLIAGLACKAPDGSEAAAAGMMGQETKMDALLLASAKIALPPPEFTADSLPDRDAPGARLVADNCGQCHSVPSPASHSATDWPRVLRRMWLRSDRLPDTFGIRMLAEGERGRVADYMIANALKTGTDLPPGPGKEEFQAICSRCHALPDIKVHANADWPAVFQRMERNMERMNVSQASQEQTSKILLYLQGAEKK
jgi:mono/diheme cytochrome c family protein